VRRPSILQIGLYNAYIVFDPRWHLFYTPPVTVITNQEDKLAQPLPESRIVERTSVDALFNGEKAFCFAINERELVPAGCFVVRVSISELRALQSRQATAEKINGRWQIQLTADAVQSR
jgi:hypothetical protein